jgi:membrane-bound lytic murein transglycosylase B
VRKTARAFQLNMRAFLWPRVCWTFALRQTDFRPRLPHLLCVLCAVAVLASASTPALARKQAAAGKSAHGGKQAGVKRHVASPHGPAYGDTARVRELAQSLAQSHQLPQAWVLQQLKQARRLAGVPQMVLPPSTPTSKNWQAYRDRFIEPRRIEAGVNFWQAHREALQRAEQRYGVPADMVVGILGVETFYGQHTGNYRVIDTLTTLTLDFPAAHPRAAQRQAFFQNELGTYLTLINAQTLANRDVKGSFAGAMGWPQFMPSSLSQFAVDFDGDGRIDLQNSPVDAIGSVAHYFQAYGWKTGMPTHYAVQFDTAKLDLPTLLAPDILPSFSVPNFEAKGAVLDDAAKQHAGPLALIELFNGDAAPSYVAGTENFYVVTRYNWSSYYAMAVIELGAAVKERMTSLQAAR